MTTRIVVLVGLCLLHPYLSVGVTAGDGDRIISAVDIYGLQRVTEDDVRKAIEIEIGKPLPYSPEELERRLEAIPGVKRIDLTPTCFPDTGCIIHIGIDETGVEPLEFRPAPTGLVELPPAIKESAGEFRRLFDEALARGGGREDYSRGHPISASPEVRTAQQRFVVQADEHRDSLRRVLHQSVASWQRAVAAEVLCYASDKRAVAADLMQAIRDPDDEVRNNAARCLAAVSFLASRQPELGIEIDPTPFIDMLRSLVWTDRQKAVVVLQFLTEKRDPAVLRVLRQEALDVLTVMARWKSIYGMQPFLLLGRVKGIPEERLKEVWGDPAAREAVLKELTTSE
jgi:hypothetical protein